MDRPVDNRPERGGGAGTVDHVLRKDFTTAGVDDNELAHRVRSGELLRIRRGAYRLPGALAAEAEHLELLRASLAQTREPGAVACHVSAAVVHGLPVDLKHLGQVHLVREGPPHSAARGPVRRHRAPVVESTMVGELPVTSLPSTVATLARLLPFAEGVAIADAALKQVSRPELLAALDVDPGRRGVVRARRVLAFADARAGSAGESRSRALMADLGLPMPDALQFEVIDREGPMYTDFVWRAQRLVGEFDGEVKYGRLLKPGEDATKVVLAEKARERRLRRLGWWAVRWVWEDLFRPTTFAATIREELAYWDRQRR